VVVWLWLFLLMCGKLHDSVLVEYMQVVGVVSSLRKRLGLSVGGIGQTNRRRGRQVGPDRSGAAGREAGRIWTSRERGAFNQGGKGHDLHSLLVMCATGCAAGVVKAGTEEKRDEEEKHVLSCVFCLV
jgi:hypothetical protein